MKTFIIILGCVCLLPACVVDTPAPEEAVGLGGGGVAVPADEAPVGGAPTDEIDTPDAPPMDTPAEVPPAEVPPADAPPMAPPADAQPTVDDDYGMLPILFRSVEVRSTFNGPSRTTEDGRVFFEASTDIALDTSLGFQWDVTVEDGVICEPQVNTVTAEVTEREIELTSDANLTRCRLGEPESVLPIFRERTVALPALEPGRYTVTAEHFAGEAPIEVEFTVVPEGQLPFSCAACGQCGDRRDECLQTCAGMRDAMEWDHAESWWSCMQDDICAPDQSRVCLDTLSCADESIISGHCDVLARCAMDGRGQLNEAHCRENPYYEARLWSCLKADRRGAINNCMDGQTCGSDLEQCLGNAACQGDMGCLGAMSTRLAVDCHGICDPYQTCSDQADPLGNVGVCYQMCDQAAFRLDDAHRRTMEACARADGSQAACYAQGAPSIIAHCVAALDCDAEPLQEVFAPVRDRCSAEVTAPIADQFDAFACLGQVIQTGLEACFADAGCDTLADCVAEVTCGDDEDCLEFAVMRVAGE